MDLSSRERFDGLVAQALAAAEVYYHGTDLHMPDEEYDTLIEEIEAISLANPDWDTKGLLDKVAAGTKPTAGLAHPVPMLSLDKVRDLEELNKFASTLDSEVTVEPKLDGLAVRAVYEAGELSLVVTRGDGYSGEDVTLQAKNISGLPNKLTRPINCEVRGEVYMTDKDFEVASQNRVLAGKAAFVNPRNATAGSLRNTDLEYEAPLSFAAYEILGAQTDSLGTGTQRLTVAKELGISTTLSLISDSVCPVRGSERIIELVEKIGRERSTLGYPIDGAVIKADNTTVREKMGTASRSPRWAVAYKYAPDTATTLLRDIEVAVGRTGRISLTAILDPVFVGGANVSRATLHNPSWIEAADIRIGDTVYVYRAGDVIPRVNAPVLSARTEGTLAWQAPAACPQCGEAWDTESLLWRCHTPSCSIAGRIEYAVSRDVLDIEGFSTALAEALVVQGLVNDLADIFTLTSEQLSQIILGDGSRKVGDSLARRIVADIEKAKRTTLARFITSLGIRGTGRTMGRRLANHFHNLNSFREATMEELMEVEGVGSEKAQLIREGLTSLAPTIDRMLSYGVEPVSPESPTGSVNKPLAGKKIVVSGAIPGMTRNEAQEAVERLGGKPSSSVSRSTDLLVLGEGAGSKAEKATSLGVSIMSAEDFARLCSEP